MEKLLTIVIPTYNAQKYLHKALDSYRIASILDKIEVLIINDGSKDGSADIAMSYVREYPLTYRMIEKENGGHGSAVNSGILHASGKYLKVVDADDWVDRDGFLALLENLEKFDTDMLISPFLWYFEKDGSTKREVTSLVPGARSYHVYPAQEIMDDIFLKMHAITFRTSILKEMPNRLTEHCFYVDSQFIVYPMPYIRNIVIIDEVVYMYRLGIDEQSMNIKNMIKRNNQHEKVIETLLDFYDNHKDDECRVLLEKTIARVITTQYKIYFCMDATQKETLKKMENRLKADYPKIYNSLANKAVGLLRRSKYLLYSPISWAVKKRYELK